MSLRKQGTCKECKAPLYGDDYGPGGHNCPGDEYVQKLAARIMALNALDTLKLAVGLLERGEAVKYVSVLLSAAQNKLGIVELGGEP